MISKIKIIFVIILLIGIFWTASFWAGINSSMQKADEEVVFVIESGQGVKTISHNLSEAELIKGEKYFNTYVWLKNWGAKIQAGEYILNKNLSIKEIAKKMVTGETESDERVIKIIEGWDIKDMTEYFAKNNITDSESFEKLARQKISQCSAELCSADFFKELPKNTTLEGYLFPDTYRIFRDATTEDIIKKMLDTFDQKLTDQMLADMKKQDKTLAEIIIMASIIEKEVPNPDDMKMISDIFYKRLDINMALQSDATINFFTHKGTTRPSLDDLEIKNPYNTYRNSGLPPGPISSPGLSAIEAAIYPKSNSYYYFLTTPKGKVIYSKDYDEHLRNKYKYY